MRDTKGFTLVELLAVIVILSIIMIMAVTAVGPMMAKSRKGTLGAEGLDLIKAGQTAYQLEQMKATSAVKSTSTVCFSLNWLYNNDLFEKGSNQGYTGSVLIAYDSVNKNYSYSFWISNGVYTFKDINQQTYDYDQADDGTTAAENCDGKGVVNCTASGTAKGECK